MKRWPIYEKFCRTVKIENFVRMVEVTVQVLHEENRHPENKLYMWVIIGYPERGKPLVLYQYHPTWSKKFLMIFLKDLPDVFRLTDMTGIIMPFHEEVLFMRAVLTMPGDISLMHQNLTKGQSGTYGIAVYKTILRDRE